MKEIIYDLEQLRNPAEPLVFITETGVDKTEGESIIASLKEIMEADKSIICLAAPQIGINKRIFCIRFQDTIKTFINPVITKKSGSKISPETFLSMRGKEIFIARPEEITAVYYTDDFKYEDNKLLGQAARVFDQAAQLLDGILPDELGLVSDIESDGSLWEATEEEMHQLVDYYKQFIAAKQKALELAINKDELDKKAYQNLRFTESIINGRTQVVADEPEPEQKTLNRAQRRSIDKMAKHYTKHKRD